jgi:hypothetical protein
MGEKKYMPNPILAVDRTYSSNSKVENLETLTDFEQEHFQHHLPALIFPRNPDIWYWDPLPDLKQSAPASRPSKRARILPRRVLPLWKLKQSLVPQPVNQAPAARVKLEDFDC